MRPRRHRKRFLTSSKVLFFCFVVITALGAYGWIHSCAPPNGISKYGVDAFYRALQMFTLNYDHPLHELDPAWHPDWELNLARFAAALFFIAALVVKLSHRVRNAITKLFYGNLFPGRQYLVVGYGKVGQGLARALKHKHPKSRVVAIDRTVSPLDREAADDAGIELYIADAQDISSFSKVPVQISRLEKILLSIGNDQQTIATASRLVERYGEKIRTVWMQLNDWTLLDRLRNSSSLSIAAEGTRRIRSFSMAEALGTQLIVKYRPALMAQYFGQNRLHAVLIRFDDFVWAIAEALVLNGTLPPPRLARPRLTIIDFQAELQEQRWLARHPALHHWVDITFIQADPTTLAFAADAPQLTDIETLDPPTLYIFGRSGDGDALADALSLRHGMEKGFRQPAPVFLSSEVEGIDKLDLRIVPANLQDRLEIIGADVEMAKYSHVIDPWFETLSEHFYAAYKKANPDKDALGKNIEETPLTLKAKYLAQEETLQVSNRRAAIHATQILAWLGFEHADATEDLLQLPQASGQALTRLFAQKPANASPGGGNWKDLWAIYEHMRWCADRAVDGWQYGARDDEARRRDQMHRGRYDYQEMGDVEVAKDTAQADATAGLLMQPRAAGHAASFTRIDTIQLQWKLSWHYENNILVLRLQRQGEWPQLGHDGEIQRIVLRVPAEATLEIGDPAFKALTPKTRRELRLAAYWNFIKKELPVEQRRRFRLLRAAAEGWQWLDKDVDPNWVEGVTLPPLTIGFIGDNGVTGSDAPGVEDELYAVLEALSAHRRPMRLITQASEGASVLMRALWRQHQLTAAFPIIVLDAPAGPGAKGDGITERILRGPDKADAAFDRPGAKQNPELREAIGERILNVCDHLIAIYDAQAPMSGARQTAERAKVLGIEVHRISVS